MNIKVIVLSVTAALLSSCATVGPSKDNLAQQQSVMVKSQPHVVSTPTARECQKKYKVLVTDTPVEDMSGYLSCMDLAEQKYGVKTPRFEPIEPSSDVLVDVHHSWHPGEMKLRNGHILRGSQLRNRWSIRFYAFAALRLVLQPQQRSLSDLYRWPISSTSRFIRL